MQDIVQSGRCMISKITISLLEKLTVLEINEYGKLTRIWSSIREISINGALQKREYVVKFNNQLPTSMNCL